MKKEGILVKFVNPIIKLPSVGRVLSGEPSGLCAEWVMPVASERAVPGYSRKENVFKWKGLSKRFVNLIVSKISAGFSSNPSTMIS
jgi:hypothetical protein